MLKGVNRQILEVTNTGSPYFEKIIFFVKAEHTASPDLKKEAEALALKMKKPPKAKRTFIQKVKIAGFIALGAGAGAALTYLMGFIA